MGIILKQLTKVVIEAVGSKKAVATISGLILIALKAAGLNLPENAIIEAVSLIVAYIIGQGIADMGKYRTL